MSMNAFYRVTRSQTRHSETPNLALKTTKVPTANPISKDGETAATVAPVGWKRKRSEIRSTPSVKLLPATLASPEVLSKKRKLIVDTSSKNSSIEITPTKVALTPPRAAAKRAKVNVPSNSTPLPITPGRAIKMTPDRVEQVEKSFVEHEVGMVYKIIRKQTGALGGNGAGGAIYGEITQKSFQRVIDHLKEHCDLSCNSRFLDIGSGLGKPNFHAAVDPGVEMSYGVELEALRWQLSLHNLKSVLKSDIYKQKTNRVMFTAGDITDAKTLNPFTHIYSFDVGFPPHVMDSLADCFNKSEAKYFASFHTPRKVIDYYGFNVENIGRVATSMAGSSEGHTCYMYKKTNAKPKERSDDNDGGETSASSSSCSSSGEDETEPKSRDMGVRDVSEDVVGSEVDPLFRNGVSILKRGNDGVLAWIESVTGEVNEGRTRRQKRQARLRRGSSTTNSRGQSKGKNSGSRAGGKTLAKPLEAYYPLLERRKVEVVVGCN